MVHTFGNTALQIIRRSNEMVNDSCGLAFSCCSPAGGVRWVVWAVCCWLAVPTRRRAPPPGTRSDISPPPPDDPWPHGLQASGRSLLSFYTTTQCDFPTTGSQLKRADEHKLTHNNLRRSIWTKVMLTKLRNIWASPTIHKLFPLYLHFMIINYT